MRHEHHPIRVNGDLNGGRQRYILIHRKQSVNYFSREK